MSNIWLSLCLELSDTSILVSHFILSYVTVRTTSGAALSCNLMRLDVGMDVAPSSNNSTEIIVKSM
jgi:hypothetical protein